MKKNKNPTLSDYIIKNQHAWDTEAWDYQQEHAEDLPLDRFIWAAAPNTDETDLRILGDFRGKKILELGCGAAQCSIWLAKRGGDCVGIDISIEQLKYAKILQRKAGVEFPLIHGNAEYMPFFEDNCFDIVFSVFGAVGFVDINKCFREVYRILKPGGIFAFSWFSPIFNCFPRSGENQLKIIRSYFDKSPLIEKKLTKKGILVTYVEFHYTYEDWFRALTENGFIVDLILEPPVKEEDDWESKTWEMFPKYKVSKIPSTTIWRAFKSPIKIQNLRELLSKSDKLLEILTEKGGVPNEKN